MSQEISVKTESGTKNGKLRENITRNYLYENRAKSFQYFTVKNMGSSAKSFRIIAEETRLILLT